MHDEIYDRGYQAGRAELHAGFEQSILRIGRLVGGTFDAIHAIHFAAPWRQPTNRQRGRPGTA